MYSQNVRFFSPPWLWTLNIMVDICQGRWTSQSVRFTTHLGSSFVRVFFPPFKNQFNVLLESVPVYLSVLPSSREAKSKQEQHFSTPSDVKEPASASCQCHVVNFPKIKHLVTCTQLAWCGVWECSSARTRLHSAVCTHYRMLAWCVQLISY